MEFLALLIVMLVLQIRDGNTPLQNDAWFSAWYNFLEKQRFLSGSMLANVILVAAMPALLLALLVFAVADLALGFPLLLILCLSLFYSMGRGNFSQDLKEYHQAWKRGDSQAAFTLLAQFRNSEFYDPKGLKDLHDMARSLILYRSFERFFAVVFYFVLFGPAVALFYRLAYLYCHRMLAQSQLQSDMKLFLHIIEWLPVRVLGLCFCLLGNFLKSLPIWFKSLFASGLCSQDYLNRMAAVSLCWEEGCGCLPEPESQSQRQAFMKVACDEVQAVQALLQHSAILILVILALFASLTW